MGWDDCWNRELKELDIVRCAKCDCRTGGEEAWVDGEIWCHPCADEISVDQQVPK